MKPLRSEDVEVQNVKLVRILPDGTGAALDGQDASRPSTFRRLRLLCIGLPTLLAAIYAFGMAAPRYQSEVKFVVRTPSSSSTSQLASLVQGGASVLRAGDESFIAKQYMLSRDAMNALIAHDGLRAVFDGTKLDLVWRYPGVFRSDNGEALLKHYLKFISVEYDTSSGISTLEMQAFDPADAQRLAGALLEHTEVFLNGLSGRAQRDAVQTALRDVDDAKNRAYAALDQVTAFRNREAVVDPTKSSSGIVQSISQLSLDTATTNARLADLVTTTPQSPEIASLRSQVTALQDQITKQRQMLGGSASSLAPRIAEYEHLLLEQQFAEKSFTSALSSLEAARLDAERQRVFLEPVTTPDLPDEPAYPYRVLTVLGVFGLALILWRVASAFGVDTWNHARR